jgi:hypothetical protein
MFSANRVFSQLNSTTGAMEWYFSAREGVIGPYISKDYAQRMLEQFIKNCQDQHSDGGRQKAAQVSQPKPQLEGMQKPKLGLELEPLPK